MLFSWQSSLFAALLSPLADQRATYPPTYGHRVVASFPHDPKAFTQGLHYEPSGTLLESTGLYGESSVRRVELATGRVLEMEPLPADLFGEGLAVCGSTCFQLTWRERLCLVRDTATFAMLGTAPIPATMREGWGLTHDGKDALYASDGSSTLHVFDDTTLQVTRRVQVTAGGSPLPRINDLQWIKGELWANLWHDERVAVIQPESGVVRCFIDLSGLLTANERRRLDSHEHVLNGLAHDPTTGRIFVTGKCWPRLFEVEVPELESE